MITHLSRMLRWIGALAFGVTSLNVAACGSAPPDTVSTSDPKPLAMPAPPALAADEFGYGIQVELLDGNAEVFLNGVRGMRFNWILQQVSWPNLEPSPGQFDWASLDVAVALANAQGIRVLLSVFGAPGWSRPAGSDPGLDGPPADPTRFGEFVHALASRYAGVVAAYEIWPGANLTSRWDSPAGLSPSAYSDLLRAAHAAVKSADPTAIVVSGALAPIGPREAAQGLGQADVPFLDGMYAEGARDAFDVLGVWLKAHDHPTAAWTEAALGPFGETVQPSDFFRHYEDIHAVMSAHGDDATRLWITSAGWGVADGAPGLPPVTEQQQAEYLVAAFQMAAAANFVEVMVIDNFNFSVVRSDPASAAFSLIRPDWTARPAFLSLARMRQDALLGQADPTVPAAPAMLGFDAFMDASTPLQVP